MSYYPQARRESGDSDILSSTTNESAANIRRVVIARCSNPPSDAVPGKGDGSDATEKIKVTVDRSRATGNESEEQNLVKMLNDPQLQGTIQADRGGLLPGYMTVGHFLNTSWSVFSLTMGFVTIFGVAWAGFRLVKTIFSALFFIKRGVEVYNNETGIQELNEIGEKLGIEPRASEPTQKPISFKGSKKPLDQFTEHAEQVGISRSFSR
ncbi:hypothetical protein CYMTET_52365 [Cymbomonas tetramitiformis]|uniref:Uncharacterized protein n=1 Tax=Cymbomonas tetramitiformis TaxID=36881 RepID=A0AAE0BJ87_9CHLO|nr:hypothetical protein CYMTET_52365 [Cymbomonas tetramitiformis]